MITDYTQKEKLIDGNPVRFVDFKTETEREYSWELGNAQERRAVIYGELVKCAAAKGEKRPDEDLLKAQTVIYETELIAPLDCIAATFSRARQSSSFIDLAALTKAFTQKTWLIERDNRNERARLCQSIRWNLVRHTIEKELPARGLAYTTERHNQETAIGERFPELDLPLAVARRVEKMSIAEQLSFVRQPKQLEANNGRL